jgi:hypothetical protein
MHYANVLDVVFVLAGLQVTKFFLSSILVVFDDAGSSCHVRFAKMWTVTDGDCANARAGGCRGGAAPPELSNSFECRSSLQRPGCSKMVEQEQWGAEGAQSPPNRSHYIRFNFNAGCSAGSAPFFVIRRITPYLFAHIVCNADTLYATCTSTMNL